jgi:hypothetical protein
MQERKRELAGELEHVAQRSNGGSMSDGARGHESQQVASPRASRR